MIDLRFRPLDKPVPRPDRQRASPWNRPWHGVLEDLERELKHLKADDITIEADLLAHQIRADGWPKGGAAATTPGVRIRFQSQHGPMCFECATFKSMEANVQAIGMTLNRLRLVDEYGATRTGEQYRGFAQLPPGGGLAVQEWANVEAALAWLSELVVLPTNTPLRRLYIEAAKAAHPDRNGGNTELMAKVNRAKDFIEKHAGAALAAR